MVDVLKEILMALNWAIQGQFWSKEEISVSFLECGLLGLALFEAYPYEPRPVCESPSVTKILILPDIGFF